MYITINSEFKPFTYDELTKPLHDYTEAYNKVEEQYATLAQQTEAWKNIATQENSPEAYAMYKKYSDELNAVVEDFSRGMTVQNRGKLTGLKSRYASEITPIANAYAAMQAANAYRDEVLAKDSTAVFTKSRYSSIDDFLNGKVADNTYISGSQIETSILGNAYAKANAAFTDLIKDGKVDEDTAARLVMSGQAFNINDVVNEELESLNINNFDPESKAKIEAYVVSGVEKGFSSFIDKQTLTAQQRESINTQRSATAESRRQFEAELASQGLHEDGSINPNSSYWALNGVSFTENEDGTVSVHSSGSTTKIDGSIYINPKTGNQFIYKDSDIKSRQIVTYSSLSESEKEMLLEAYDLASLPEDAQVEKMTLAAFDKGVRLKLHNDEIKINNNNNSSSGTTNLYGRPE